MNLVFYGNGLMRWLVLAVVEDARGRARGLRRGCVGGGLCVSGSEERTNEAIWVPEAVTKWGSSDLRLLKVGIGTSSDEGCAESPGFCQKKIRLQVEYDTVAVAELGSDEDLSFL